MSHCETYEVSCFDTEYHIFDDICTRELALGLNVQKISNESDYCVSLALEIIAKGEPDDLTLNEHISGLKKKFGLYQLWIDIDHCDDHKINTLLCVYVGKGMAEGRVLSHIKEKWPQAEWFVHYIL
jgi:hypothetical protein